MFSTKGDYIELEGPDLMQLDIQVPKDFYELLDAEGYQRFCWETYGRYVAGSSAKSIKIKITVV